MVDWDGPAAGDEPATVNTRQLAGLFPPPGRHRAQRRRWTRTGASRSRPAVTWTPDGTGGQPLEPQPRTPQGRLGHDIKGDTNRVR